MRRIPGHACLLTLETAYPKMKYMRKMFQSRVVPAGKLITSLKCQLERSLCLLSLLLAVGQWVRASIVMGYRPAVCFSNRSTPRPFSCMPGFCGSSSGLFKRPGTSSPEMQGRLAKPVRISPAKARTALSLVLSWRVMDIFSFDGACQGQRTGWIARKYKTLPPSCRACAFTASVVADIMELIWMHLRTIMQF